MDHRILIIVVISLVTIAVRALPFLVFRGKNLPKTVKYLGDVLPSAIMIVLVVYCLKYIDIFTGTHGIPEFIAVGVVILVHLWKKNTLLSIGLGTCVYMILVQAVFV